MKCSLYSVLAVLLTMTLVFSCTSQPKPEPQSEIIGTWKLIQGTIIEAGDTTATDYTDGISFIKIINESHFAFFNHDLNKGQDSATAVFVAGAGEYTLEGNKYTENLEYCSGRPWEGHEFEFTITVEGDKLVQEGLEEIEDQGVNRLIKEEYIRLK